jgi:hypothetical protein
MVGRLEGMIRRGIGRHAPLLRARVVLRSSDPQAMKADSSSVNASPITEMIVSITDQVFSV